MRCFYVLKKWSSAKLSLNRDLSLNKMSLNRDCTVLLILLLILNCLTGLMKYAIDLDFDHVDWLEGVNKEHKTMNHFSQDQ